MALWEAAVGYWRRGKIQTGRQLWPLPATTCGEVLHDARGCCVENDVSAIVKVMQIVAAVKSSVAKHVVQSQLLRTHTVSHP